MCTYEMNISDGIRKHVATETRFFFYQQQQQNWQQQAHHKILRRYEALIKRKTLFKRFKNV